MAGYPTPDDPVPALRLPIEGASGSMPIHIGCGVGPGCVATLPGRVPSRCFVLTDVNVERLRGKLDVGVAATGITVPAGESAKEWPTVARVLEELHAQGADREALLVDHGGGMVGDLGGFAASIYLRGIDFVQVPTTLLAQVDASVGGKVGVNAFGEKNRIGVFAQPRAVFVDPDQLTTLDEREYRSGFAEMVKHGLIADADHLEECVPSLADAIDPARLAPVIERSIRVKASIVARDPRETGDRRLLNFGHTLGHAVEALALRSGAPLLHGEAVAIGMVAALRLSSRLRGLREADAESVEARLRSLGLPVRIPAGQSTDALTDVIQRDKKARRGVVGWTLLDGVGQGVAGVAVEPADLRRVIDELRAPA